MKIVHVLGSLGMGGAERVALDLATTQRDLGHEVLAISLSGEEGGGPLASAFAESEVPVHVVAKKPGLDWTLPPRIAKALRSLDVDVVHTHNTPPLVYVAAAARISRHVVVHTKHGEGHLVSRAGQFLRRFGAPFVHSFVAVSQKTAEHAREQWAYPLPSRIKVITNGIRLDVHRPDSQSRGELRAELGIAENAWVVGTVGRCDENKNQVALIRALDAHLSEKVQLVVVGDGDRMAALKEARAASACPQAIHILGRRNDAHRVISSLDVFALPSLSEGLPLVILEAMATEIPIVSTNVGGIPKVIEHK
ncbi:MAG: glycosyltransferase [Myxococcales bacterium]|nr:glycosyltransferase [Myxococcales bacterium]